MNPVTRSANANNAAARPPRAASVRLMTAPYRCRRHPVAVVSRHVSDQVALEPTRRRLTPKQADTIARLSAATLAVLRREGFSGLTVRLVAAEAGIGAATAY